MSQENIDFARQYVEAFNSGGLEAIEGFHDPEIVFDLSGSPFPDAGVYRGPKGVRDWFQGLADAFGNLRYEVEEMYVVNDRVAVLVRVIGRGPSSRIDVDYRFAPVFTLRDRKVIRMDRYSEWTEALEAVGRSD